MITKEICELDILQVHQFPDHILHLHHIHPSHSTDTMEAMAIISLYLITITMTMITHGSIRVPPTQPPQKFQLYRLLPIVYQVLFHFV
jgi:hypothetical protein